MKDARSSAAHATEIRVECLEAQWCHYPLIALLGGIDFLSTFPPLGEFVDFTPVLNFIFTYTQKALTNSSSTSPLPLDSASKNDVGRG